MLIETIYIRVTTMVTYNSSRILDLYASRTHGVRVGTGTGGLCGKEVGMREGRQERTLSSCVHLSSDAQIF